jgi:putative zinc finger/helix-turn-helix YgiT family protein
MGRWQEVTQKKSGFCPVCNSHGGLSIKRVRETYPVRGESIAAENDVAFCASCGAEVYDHDLDAATMERVYAEYRRRHDLISPDELVVLREKYDLGQRGLAKLLDWSPVTIYRYEKGALPLPAHADALRRLTDPSEMKRLIGERGHMLRPRELKRAQARLESVPSADHEASVAVAALEKRFGADRPSPETGFREFDFDKLVNMMLFFAQESGGLYKTSMMKHLWYADFLHFKRNAVSISGARYAALPNGPALDKWLLCLQAAVETGEVSVEPVAAANWEADLVKAEADFRKELFTADEIETMEEVAKRLHGISTRKLVERSHLEDAWKLTPVGKAISYNHALNLKW